mmetsp:Transcript_117918/g.366576  ORF Transcript_117918/g.366576 Transcript_117918/m.366576 type:complete len:540 (-) Transcript_117918:104-1723(-)
MYTLDALFQDVAHRRGQVQKGSGGGLEAEYAEVWSSFIRYLVFCLDQRRGLNLSNFCRVGWHLEKKLNGQGSYRPFFQLSDQFCRAYLTPDATRKHTTNAHAMAGAELCPFEDFNFSKAAIRFSSLTKDQVFTDLRSLVQRLGEVIADGREVEIAFGELGKLVARGGEPRFSFAAEVYTREGLEAPPSAPAAGSLRTAAAFQREVPKASVGLGVRGKQAAPEDAPPQARQPALQTTQPPRTPPLTPEPAPMEEAYRGFSSEDMPLRGQTPSRRSLASSGSAPSLSLGGGGTRAPGLTNQQFKREIAYKEAMDRHISAMEARANEAVQEREAWQEHVVGCLEQERDEIQHKRVRNQQNLHFLQHQMQLGEQKRKDQRKEDIVTASAHDFPKFSEPADEELKDFVKGQQSRMRADLDEQVRTNNTLRNLSKQRERTLEVNQLETNRQEMAMLRNAERAKKAYDREALATAWNSEIRMKNIWKAIESHNKVGSQAPDVLNTEALPPSRGGSTVSAGRIMTGSSRRAPLGASSSLSRLGTGAR